MVKNRQKLNFYDPGDNRCGYSRSASPLRYVSDLISHLVAYAFLGIQKYACNAYIAIMDMTQSSDANTRKAVCLQRVWGLEGAVDTSTLCTRFTVPQNQNPPGRTSGRKRLAPEPKQRLWALSILRGESDCGAGFAAGARARTRPTTPSFYPRLPKRCSGGGGIASQV